MTQIHTLAVVCPTYNSANFIEATLRSVLTQSILPAEIVVSDDGSTDRTVQVVELFAQQNRQLPVRLLRNPHRGPGAARNAGIRAATAEWIAFLDSDDEWLPEKLAVVSRAIAAQPTSNFFCHSERHLRFDGSSGEIHYGRFFNPAHPVPPQLFRRCFFSTSAVVCRRELLLNRGLFDEKLQSSQDYELWLRLSPHLRPHFIDEVLGCYRDRAGNISSGNFHRRMMNLLRVHLRHRDKVAVADLVSVLSRWAFNYGPRRLLCWLREFRGVAHAS